MSAPPKESDIQKLATMLARKLGVKGKRELIYQHLRIAYSRGILEGMEAERIFPTRGAAAGQSARTEE